MTRIGGRGILRHRPCRGPDKREKKPFVFTGDWKVLADSGGNIVQVKDDGWRVRFETPEDCVSEGKAYRSVWGGISHNGSIYKNSGYNLSRGLSRILSGRVDLPTELALRSRQKEFIENAPTYLSKYLQSCFDVTFLDTFSEALAHHDDPHPKKRLRMEAFHEIMVDMLEGSWLAKGAARRFTEYVLYKCKKGEIAKPGKFIRLIGDLGCPASLRGFWVTKLIKKKMAAEDFILPRGRMHFCMKPGFEELRNVFTRLIEPEDDFYFVYHSDDSCLSFRDPEGDVHWFNIDISSCDTSHSQAIFELLSDVSAGEVERCIDKLVKQLGAPILVVNPECRRQFVLLVCTFPRLFSGSTLTTLLNNVANLLIGTALYEAYENGELVAGTDFAPIIARAGYICSGTLPPKLSCETFRHADEECYFPEDILFLKHFPVTDAKLGWVPVKGIGVFFRSYGRCKGDLPGRAIDSLPLRAQAFDRAFLRGMFPRTFLQFLEPLRAELNSIETPGRLERAAQKAYVRHHAPYHAITDNPGITVSDSQWSKRYRLTESELCEIQEFFAVWRYGLLFRTTGTSKVLEVDYDLR